MGTRKKLRKRAEKLAYRVQIAENEALLAELQQRTEKSMGFCKQPQGAHGKLIENPGIEEGEMVMGETFGGKPSKGTKPDKRLKENKPKPVMPVKKGK